MTGEDAAGSSAAETGPAYPGAFVETRGDHPAYVMAGTGQVVTYAELDDRANRLARVFRDAGLQAGDHVAFCLENHPEFLAIAWGAHYAGLYYTAISSRLHASEAAYIVDDCGARVFIASPFTAEIAEGILSETPKVELRLAVGGDIEGHLSYEAAVAAADPTPLEVRVEGMDMLYSSGTTGRPKGVKVPLSGAPLGSPNPLHMLVTMLFGANPDTVYLSPAPLYHAAPLRFSMTVQRCGGTVIVMEHFDPVEALRLIDRYQVTFAQMVPTMFVRLLKLPAEDRDGFDGSSLTHVVHAAAPCPVPVKRQMIQWWGPVIHEYYAGTEGNGFCYANSEDWLAHEGTVGKSLLGPLHVCDDEGAELPVGEAGTVYFESSSGFAYHNDPAKTADSYHPQGWSTLGDVGYVDDDGFLYLTDRKAYMIIRGGVNVYPQEAENVLTMHPKVADVAVFGIPDEDFGEEVHAVVQPAEGVEPGPELEAELIAFCRSQLASMKCPRRIDFRDELPRHPTGKLYKRLLKDEYWPQ
ncbi:MAG: acyl-CoA synthetase [Microthrixaceae bacterium]|nr:acyl-CoA synthetase [Microthrixaceae bacterium]